MIKVVALTVVLASQLCALTTSKPRTLSDPRQDADESKVAMNEKGDASLIWLATEGKGEMVQGATRSVNGDWNHHALSDWEDSIYRPFCYVDSSGTTWNFWEVDDSIFFTKKPQGFSAVFDSDAFYSLGLSEKKPELKYLFNVGGAEKKEVQITVKYQSGITIFDLDTLHYSLSKQLHALAEDKKNGLFLIKEWTPNGTILHGLLEENGLVFPPEKIATLKDSNQIHYRAAINKQGHAVIIWTDYGDGSEKLFAVTRHNNNWSKPIQIAPQTDLFSAKTAIDSTGNMLLVWEARQNSGSRVFASYKGVDRPWTAPIELSNAEEQIDSPMVRTDQAGHFVVVWEQKKHKAPPGIYGASFSTETEEWSNATQLSPPGEICSSPSFAFSSEGRGLISWTNHGNGYDMQIQVADLNID